MDQPVIEHSQAPKGAREPRRRRRARTTPETQLFRAIEATFAVGPDDLCGATRGRCDIAFARQTGMYLARVTLGMTLADAGLLFGRDRTTAAHACRLVEDLRDDPQFDALLEAMEASVLRSEQRRCAGGSR